jgi:hypothetical protein
MAAVAREYAAFVQFLQSRSAATLDHVTGTLLEHLDGTHDLLRQWGNPPAVCRAGLAHAVYGTSGFPVAVLDARSERGELSRLIGPEAEALVYFYASCDRPFVYPQIAAGAPVLFRDRFTGDVFTPSGSLLARFMEVTFANELEILSKDPGLADQIKTVYGALFARSRSLVSDPAFACFTRLCAHPAPGPA